MGYLFAFLLGTAVQPYLALLLEWWLSRPKRLDPLDIHGHCGPKCEIQR